MPSQMVLSSCATAIYHGVAFGLDLMRVVADLQAESIADPAEH